MAGDLLSDLGHPLDMVVEKDLVLDGNIALRDVGTVIVTGDVRVRNIDLHGNVSLAVGGDLMVSGSIHAIQGGDTAMLTVAGDTTAPTIYGDFDAILRFATQPDSTLIVADPRLVTCFVHVGISELLDIIRPDLLPESISEKLDDPGEITDGDVEELEHAVCSELMGGGSLLRPGANPGRLRHQILNNDHLLVAAGLPIDCQLPAISRVQLSFPVPDGLQRLQGVTELKIGPSTSARSGAHVLPLDVTRLSELRTLDLRYTTLAHIPDALLNLRELENLYLGNLIYVNHLPDLSVLPHLRKLRINGSGRASAYSATRYPARTLLDGVWRVTTLEELTMDEWSCTVKRHNAATRDDPLTTLPDDAFAAMPRLRRLSLRDTALTKLPESFYGLTELEDVHLEFAALHPDVRRRLAALTAEPDNPAFDWLRAYQARTLIKAGRRQEALLISERVLARRPTFPGLPI